MNTTTNLAARILVAAHNARIAAEKAELNAYCEATKARYEAPREPRPAYSAPPGAMKAWHR